MRWLAALALCAMPLPLQAAPAEPSLRAALVDLARADARLQSIAWRLARANAPLCSARQSAIGLLLTDARAFRDPAAVQAALGTGEVSVGAVARGSPAERAGVRAGETLVALDGQLTEAVPVRARSDYRRLDFLHERIAHTLAGRGAVRLRLRDGHGSEREAVVAGETVCASRFELLTDGGKAQADGMRVQIAQRLLAEHPSDAEAATLIAHEFAHNLLQHRRRLTGRRTAARVRASEREADRLAPWLLANAGYDPAAAARFMAAWGPRHDDGLLRAPDHDGWKRRLAAIEGELGRIAALRAGGSAGLLDWRPTFPLAPL